MRIPEVSGHRFRNDLGVSIAGDLIVSSHGGELYLFPFANWGDLIDDLAVAKPSLERNAIMSMIGLAVEVEISAGRLEVPELIRSRLGPNPAILPAGKQIGIISRAT